MILMNKVAIIFNGPPGSGKDMICDYLQEKDKLFHHVRFKDHLFKLVKVIYNITDNQFDQLYLDRELKEQPSDLFNGLSPRQALINVSEHIIKPNFGQSYFGQVAAENLKPGINVFSDGGFYSEIESVYNATNGHMIIIQIERDGCDFSNDSRDYIDEFRDIPILRLSNNGTKEDFIKHVESKILNHFEITTYYNQGPMDYTTEIKLVGRN